MAIEKMSFLNLVGERKIEDSILEQLILTESLHLHLNYSEVYENSFAMHEFILKNFGKETSLQDSEYNRNADEERQRCEVLENLLTTLASDFEEEITVRKEYLDSKYTIDDVERDLMNIKEFVQPITEQIKMRQKRIEKLLAFKDEIHYIVGQEIDFTAIENLHYMNYQLGVLSKENNAHIKRNYENISAIVLRIGKKEKEDVYFVIYPKQYNDEVNRILQSVNWEPLHIPEGLSGTPSNMLNQMNEQIARLQKEIDELQATLYQNKQQATSMINKCAVRIQMQKRIEEIRQNIDYGNHVFVISGWIPEKEKQLLDKQLGVFGDRCVAVYRDAQEIEEVVQPPTKLRNHRLVQPFETIVGLYGLPAYNEFDPTLFLSITYWLMFGIMFGDIGQGFVFFVAGWLLNKKQKYGTAGGILTRLGIGSMIFGLLYGSLFGLEDLPWLPHIIGSPLQGNNIAAILVAGVVFGVVVLTISYAMGIINALRRGDIEEGIFGKNGILGYLFFIGLVMTLAGLAGYKILPTTVSVMMMVVALLIIVFKQPLAHLVEGKRPLHKDDASSYYVESGFETVETILSALSNTISFIRVGAFALNHAGLFLAFMVMAKMMNNVILQIVILIVGNILILTLEGLVVFIQGLRLEYYEMFSKYFTGGGEEYKPLRLND